MRAIILALLALTLTACAGSDRSARDLSSAGSGPDEFSVTPSKPLQLPSELTLPEPTPGGTNLTDTNPVGEAIAALGGRQISVGGVPRADAGLVAFVSRNGVDPNIRAVVAAEDAAKRNRLGRFGFLRRGDRYFAAYARQALDAYAELARFRAAGVTTPSAPPE